MPKISTDPGRHALNGPTMGTRWSALFFAQAGYDPEPVRAALQAAVDEVDALHAFLERADGAGDREPVDPAVRPEAAVLALDDGGADGGADVLQRHPGEAAALEVDALAVEEAAVTGVGRWKFRPGQKNGRPVNTRMRVPILFRLANTEL